MHDSPPQTHLTTQALQAAWRTSGAPRTLPRLIVAGATGVLGNEVMHRLVGGGQFSHAEVLACEAMSTGMRGVGIALTEGDDIDRWPVRPVAAQTGVVMFEPPRLYHGRERSLWTPQPGQLPALARWLRRCGVRTLVVVLPHATGRLPEALKRGLANLDELGLAALGFERLLLVRSARKPEPANGQNLFERTAAWMLSTLSYMIPASEQPVRPAKLAHFVEVAMRWLPEGTHVAPPELLWRANQTLSQLGAAGDHTRQSSSMTALVKAWLEARHNHGVQPSTQQLPTPSAGSPHAQT